MSRSLKFMLFALTLIAFGCQAQPPGASISLAATTPGSSSRSISPEMARRMEVAIRSRANVPANYQIHIGRVEKSDIPGFDSVPIDFSADGKANRQIVFLVSNDGRTMAQFTKFDISKDPKELVSGANRPARGGPSDAPVLIVGFDDLECPFCAKMNAELFPAVLERYKNQVRIVYRDFPLSQHPWAIRAAIDTNCVGTQSSTGYWNLVDYIHAHADEIGGSQKTLVKASEMLDSLAREEGKRQKLDETKLAACIQKQDEAGIKQSMKEAEALGVDSTPALFINGEKIEGAQPLEYVYRMIDGALIAAGQTPPAAEAAKPAPYAKPAS